MQCPNCAKGMQAIGPEHWKCLGCYTKLEQLTLFTWGNKANEKQVKKGDID